MSTSKKPRNNSAKASGRKKSTAGKVAPLGSTATRKPRQSKQTAKAKANKPKPTVSYEQIAQRAEAIWRQRGCTAGQDEQNWHEAEAQLKRELGAA